MPFGPVRISVTIPKLRPKSRLSLSTMFHLPHVVRDQVVQPRVADPDALPARVQLEAEEVAALEEVPGAAHEQVVLVLVAEALALQEADGGGADLVDPRELGVGVVRAREHLQARQRLGRRGRRGSTGASGSAGARRTRSARTGRSIGACVVSIVRNCVDPRGRPHDLDPAGVHARLDELQLAEGVVAVGGLPEPVGDRVERHAVAVAEAVGVDLLDVLPDVAAHLGAVVVERVPARRGAVRVEPEDDAREVRVVGHRPAEDVVHHGRVGRAVVEGRRPAAEVLRPAAAAGVADEDVELAVVTDADDAAVVVPRRVLRRARAPPARPAGPRAA